MQDCGGGGGGEGVGVVGDVIFYGGLANIKLAKNNFKE